MTIYFDNAATSFPKPPPVLEAVTAFLRDCGNPGRGGHRLSLEGARRIFETRENVASFLGVKASERILFTPGCTHSISDVLKGRSEKGSFSAGDLVLTGPLEHNAVTRPLHQIKRKHDLTVELLDVESQQIQLEKKPVLMVLNAASNVTGAVLDLEKISAYCLSHNIPLLIDAAQTAGKIDVDLDKLKGVTFYCASSHKGFLGAPGAGILYIAEGWESELEPTITGGTGSKSEDLAPPSSLPDRFEAGTADGPAIISINAGIDWIKQKGANEILQHELNLKESFIDWAKNSRFMHIVEGGYGKFTHKEIPSLATVSFLVEGVPSSTVAAKLDEDYQIAVRGGLHCSRQAHLKIGSLKSGLVRASFGHNNTVAEVETLCRALNEITK